MTTVIVNGACGRMGQAVLKAVQEADGLELVGAVDIKGGADTSETAKDTSAAATLRYSQATM